MSWLHRMWRTRRIALLAAIVVIGTGGRLIAARLARAAESDSNGAAVNAADRAMTYLRARSEKTGFSGAVLVAQRNQLLIREAFGKADFELNVPLRPDHIFLIGSLTKPFTATAVLALAERNTLQLSDPICKYVMHCSPAWQGVTLRHLLSHTSGIPDLFGQLKSVPVRGTRGEVDRLLAELGDKAVASGDRIYSYSNFNYVLLGYAIEVATGRPWDAIVSSHVLAPAGLVSDTAYDDVWGIVPRRVHGYVARNGKLEKTRYHDHAAYAAGGLHSTVDDLYRWHEAYLHNRVIGQKSVELALTPVQSDYGYGWQITKQFGQKVHNHTGGMRGFASHLAYYHDDRLLVIVLSNVESEDTKATACDVAAIVLNTEAAPRADSDWLSQSRSVRCQLSAAGKKS